MDTESRFYVCMCLIGQLNIFNMHVSVNNSIKGTTSIYKLLLFLLTNIEEASDCKVLTTS